MFVILQFELLLASSHPSLLVLSCSKSECETVHRIGGRSSNEGFALFDVFFFFAFLLLLLLFVVLVPLLLSLKKLILRQKLNHLGSYVSVDKERRFVEITFVESTVSCCCCC